jgi:dethiobiotin synthase
VRIVVVTGTNTGVGKTIACAALVSHLLAAGRSVAMVKPTQTGTAEAEPTDAETIARLSGSDDVAELVSLEDPLAPDSAARLRAVSTPRVDELADEAVRRYPDHDVLLLEGAGGVLVRLDTEGGTLVDLADALLAAGHDVRFVVVTTLALGTLNHTELTVDLLRGRGHHVAGLILGSVPDELGLAETCNVGDLARVTELPLLGELPADIGALAPADFRASSGQWFAPTTVDVLTGTTTRAAGTATN